MLTFPHREYGVQRRYISKSILGDVHAYLSMIFIILLLMIGYLFSYLLLFSSDLLFKHTTSGHLLHMRSNPEKRTKINSSMCTSTTGWEYIFTRYSWGLSGICYLLSLSVFFSDPYLMRKQWISYVLKLGPAIGSHPSWLTLCGRNLAFHGGKHVRGIHYAVVEYFEQLLKNPDNFQ